MSLTLRLNTTSTIPICVGGIVPNVTCRMSEKEVAELVIWMGNRKLPVGELFDVQKNGDQSRIVWQGDLASVHWIGANLESGSVIVEGNVGRHLGSQMKGGKILVQGNASDFVACENRGGVVRINGNAGNWLGAAYPGTKSGANGGTIFVAGNTGSGTGFAMRRGMVCVQGNSGRLTGWNMLAGTILVAGSVGTMAGKGMKRGTLLLPSQQHQTLNQSNLPVSFLAGGTVKPMFLNIMQNWLQQSGFPCDLRTEYSQFHGDQLKGGRGEVLISCL